MASDSSPLPADVTQVIFRALYLSTEEKKGVLYLLEDDTRVSITTMRTYIAQRFKTYEMIASALGVPAKPQFPPPPPRLPPTDITAGSATTKDDNKYEDEDEEHYEDEELYEDEETDEEEEEKTDKTDEVKKTADSNRTDVIPICLFCTKKNMPDIHWISDCRSLKSSSKLELRNMWFCTLCLYLKKSNTSHWCKDFFSRNRLFCKKKMWGAHQDLQKANNP